jgi:hypothetical protein
LKNQAQDECTYAARGKKLRILLMAVLVLLTTIPVLAQTGGVYDLSWSKIAGGGGTSSGGIFSLGGSIGQPDAGRMEGGAYVLNGGFWIEEQEPVTPPGAFEKGMPANGATGISTSPTLSWGSSTGADSYEYCYDTTNDNNCSGWTSTGTATTIGLSGLSEGTTYYWQVRAQNTGGTTYANGSSTAYWSFTTQTTVTPPGAFNKTTPSNGATGISISPTLSWGSSTGVDSYEYCYDTTNDNNCSGWTSTGTATSIGLSGLSEGTTYYWQVRAQNTGGTTYANGSSTAHWSFTTQTTVTPPGGFNKTTPSNAATGISTSPTLSWGSSTGADSYEYCYDTTNDNNCSGWTSTGTATSIGLSGLSEGTTYYWQVRAQNTGGTTYANGSSTSYWSFTTLTSIIPPGSFSKTAPANTATNVSINPTLSWGSSTYATSYEYCFDTTNDNSCTGWTSTGTVTYVELSGLSYETTYYWHVRAKNSIDTTYSNDSQTAYWSFTTKAQGDENVFIFLPLIMK